jgi:hypothetical protein
MAIDKNTLSAFREKHAETIEKKNPFMALNTLMNNYHAIDLMQATQAEKDWAKQRLTASIDQIAKTMNPYMQRLIQKSLKHKRIWEETRDRFAIK